jgi:hypothetical protein
MTDREALLALLAAVDAHLARPGTPTDRLRCAARIDAASSASYAAGAAHGVDARPDRPQGFTVDP